MKVLRRIWNDVQRGENIDLYVLLVVAISTSIVSLLGFIPEEYLLPIILSGLALIAVSVLINRHKSEQILESVRHIQNNSEKNIKVFGTTDNRILTTKQFFQTRSERPPLEFRLHGAKTVDILGTSLVSLSISHQGNIRELVESGAKVRLLVSNPNNKALQEFLSLRYLEAETAEIHKHQVDLALENFRSLLNLNGKSGNIEVHITDRMQSFSYMGIDTYTPRGNIQIEFYLNKIPLGRNPIFLMNADTDTDWYDEFRKQFEFYWDNSSSAYS